LEDFHFLHFPDFAACSNKFLTICADHTFDHGMNVKTIKIKKDLTLFGVQSVVCPARQRVLSLPGVDSITSKRGFRCNQLWKNACYAGFTAFRFLILGLV